MPHINCNFCGEKIWGDKNSLPEIGLCKPCKTQNESVQKNTDKLDNILNLLGELKDEQSYIVDKIYRLEGIFFDELRCLKNEIGDVAIVQTTQHTDVNSSDSDEDNWEYSEADARAEVADAEYEGEKNEAAYAESESASEQCGED